MSASYVAYPVFQIRTWGCLAYERKEWLVKPRKPDREKKKPDHNKYTGKVTAFARKRLKRAIQLLVASAVEKEAINFKTGKLFKFKVNFITLTLPAPQRNVTDKEIKRYCLDNWIKRAKRKHKLGSYVWRAERQKNGNLHFHIITDTYIHYSRIQSDWNSLLSRFHFIDEFYNKHGHRNPNSTDVHSVTKIKNLTQYFIKYMTKSEKDNESIEGKIWDCSKNLKTKENCEFEFDNETRDFWTLLMTDEKLEKKTDPNFTLVFMNQSQFDYRIRGKFKEGWEKYLDKIRLNGHEDIGSSV